MNAIAIGACILAFIAVDVRAADPSAAARARKTAEFLMAGVLDSRERLRRAAVHGEGEIETLYPNGERVDGKITFAFAFDLERNLYRAERREPRFTRSRGAKRSPALKEDNFLFVRIPGKTFHYQTASREIQILSEDRDPTRMVQAFDFRAVGMLYRDGYEEQKSFREIYDLFAMYSADEVVDEGGGIYRVRWILVNGAHRRTMWLDRKKGFSITRLEVCDRRVPPMPTGDDGWPLPFLINEATWTQVNDAWVPATFRIHDRLGALDSDPSWTITHRFTWDSVNEVLPQETFDVDGLGAKKGTLVVDYRGKAPIVLRAIGVENTRLEGESRRGRLRPPEQPASASSWQVWFIVGNAVVLLIVVAIVAVRIWNRQQASGTGPG